MPNARITTRCVDKGDNSRILAWCDFCATEPTGHLGKAWGVRRTASARAVRRHHCYGGCTR